MAASGGARLLGFGFLVGAKDEASPVFDRIAESARKMRAAASGIEETSASVDALDRSVASLNPDTLKEGAADGAEAMKDLAERSSDASEQLDHVSESAARAADHTSRWNTILQALSLHRLNQMADSMRGLAERAGVFNQQAEGLQATGIESFGVQFANTYRTATAGLGEFAGIVDHSRRQISSLAYGLEVSAESMLAVNSAVARTGHSLDEYGISQRALAGMLKAGLVEGDAFGGMLATMTDRYRLSASAAGDLVSRMTSLGEHAGDVQGAMSGLPQIMAAVNDASSRFPDIGENFDGVTMSVMRLATGMHDALGISMQDSVASAVNVFNKLTEQRGSLTDMFTGLGSDFSQVATELGVASGDINGAVDAVLSNPDEFATTLSNLYATMGEGSTGAARLSTILHGIDPNFTALIHRGTEAADTLNGLRTPAENAASSFERVGNAAAHQSRTLSESMQRNQDAFTNSLNRMTRRLAGGAGGILRQQQAMFGRTKAMIEDYAGRSGPLGMLTRGFLRSRAGMYGFTSTLQALGGPLLDSAASMAPMVAMASQMGVFRVASGAVMGFNSALGGMPGKLLGVLGPIGLLAGAGYLIYKNWDNIGDLFTSIKAKILKAIPKFEELTARALAWVDGVDWDAMGHSLVLGIQQAFGAMEGAVEGAAGGEGGPAAQSLGRAFGNLFKAVAHAVPALMRGIWDAVVQYVSEPSDVTGRIKRGAAVGGVAIGAAMFTPLLGPLVRSGIGMLLRVFGSLSSSLAGSAFSGFMSMGLKKIPVVGAIIGGLMELPNAIESFQKGDTVGALRHLFHGVLDGLLLGIPSLIESFTGTNVFGQITDFLFASSNMGNVTQAIQDGNWGRAVAEGLFMSMNTALLGLPGMIRTALSGEKTGDAFGPWMESFGNFFSGIGDTLSEAWSGVSSALSDFWQEISGPLEELGKVAKEVFLDAILPAAEAVFGFLRTVGAAVFGFVANKATWLWDNVLHPVFSTIYSVWANTWNDVAGVLKTVLKFVVTTAVHAFFGIIMAIENLKIAWNTMKGVLVAGITYVGLTIRNFFLNPFIEAKSTVLSMLESMQIGFLTVKRSVVGLGLSLLQLLQRMPGASLIAGPLDAGIESLTRMQEETDRTMDSLATAGRRRREEMRAEQAANAAEAESARAAMGATAQAGARAARPSVAHRLEQEQRVQRSVDSIFGASERLGGRVSNVVDRAGQSARVGIPATTSVSPAATPESAVAGAVEAVTPPSRATARAARMAGESPRVAAARRTTAAERRAQTRQQREPRTVVITEFLPAAFRQLDHALTVHAPQRHHNQRTDD